jgi:hypothetical protein
MKKTTHLLAMTLLLAAAVTLLSFDKAKDWMIAGSHPKSYDMGIDKGAGKDGNNAATIRSTAKKIHGFGTLMQICQAKGFHGKRIKMSGMVKTENVEGWAGLWLRVDQKDSDEILGFDNMKDGKTDRAIIGTTDWTRYEIVLDVPANASNLAYGALLSGTGQVWFDEIRFEEVDPSVPVTGREDSVNIPREPVNLDFEGR